MDFHLNPFCTPTFPTDLDINTSNDYGQIDFTGGIDYTAASSPLEGLLTIEEMEQNLFTPVLNQHNQPYNQIPMLTKVFSPNSSATYSPPSLFDQSYISPPFTPIDVHPDQLNYSPYSPTEAAYSPSISQLFESVDTLFAYTPISEQFPPIDFTQQSFLPFDQLQSPNSTRARSDSQNSSYSTSTGTTFNSFDENMMKKDCLPCPHLDCSKVFTRAFNLKSHMKSHTSDKTFSCDICSSTFRRSHDLKRHIRSLHVANKAYGCKTCGKRFARTDALKRHVSRPGTICSDGCEVAST